ncbi:MAG: DUF305 domain-containing protein [Dokdonella sp.]
MSAPASAMRTTDPYTRLLVVTFISFLTIYALMYAMVDRSENVYRSFNQVFMTGLLVAPIVLIELALMWDMFPDRRRNVVITVVAFVATVFCWVGIREQLGVRDRQLIRSMIPSHAAAILMCEEAQLKNPELQRLCNEVVESHKAQIEQMKALLEEPAS